MGYKYTDDDYCDIYENKICDNCGKCLEMEGIDVRAIKIEDIAKSEEENKVIEKEFLEDLKANLTDEELEEIEEQKLDLQEIYNKFKDKLLPNEKLDSKNYNEEEYIDAFDNIEYLDAEGIYDDNLDEMTEEIYPGVRKLIRKDK